MGDLLSSKKNEQTTQNQQVGVSGSGVGQSGTVGGSQAANNSTALGNLTASGNAAINIVTSDLEAIQANKEVALAATNAGLQTSIHSLDVVQRTQENAAYLVAQVQAGANEVALKATPVSAGDVATAQTAALKPVLIAVVLLGGIILLSVSIKRNKT